MELHYYLSGGHYNCKKTRWQIKKGTGLRDGQRYNRLQEKLQGVCHGNVPEWMGTGKKISIKKDPAKGNQASNYLPIACLSMTGIMGEK